MIKSLGYRIYFFFFQFNWIVKFNFLLAILLFIIPTIAKKISKQPLFSNPLNQLYIKVQYSVLLRGNLKVNLHQALILVEYVDLVSLILLILFLTDNE